MLIDHVGAVFFPQYQWLRLIGRLSMPLFAYAIATGYYFTTRQSATTATIAELPDASEVLPAPNDRRFLKYLLHMAIFAAVSQFPFYFFFAAMGISTISLNIGFTWTLALIVLHGVFSRKPFWIAAAIIAIITSIMVPMDYGLYGVLYPLACYGIVLAVRSRADRKSAVVPQSAARQPVPVETTQSLPIVSQSLPIVSRAATAVRYLCGSLSQLALNFLGVVILGFWQFQALALLSLPLMSLDPGRKSRISKWFFYIFYPAHLALLAMLRCVI